MKERAIYSRERDFNLRIDSYYLSKFLVLVPLALIQVTLLFTIVKLWCGPPGAVLWQWTALAMLGVAGTTLGLLISALARTEEVAVALVPIAVMPQIILGGVIAPLSPALKVLAQAVITVWWSAQAQEALLPEGERALLHVSPAEYATSLLAVAGHVVIFRARDAADPAGEKESLRSRFPRPRLTLQTCKLGRSSL